MSSTIFNRSKKKQIFTWRWPRNNNSSIQGIHQYFPPCAMRIGTTTLCEKVAALSREAFAKKVWSPAPLIRRQLQSVDPLQRDPFSEVPDSTVRLANLSKWIEPAQYLQCLRSIQSRKDKPWTVAQLYLRSEESGEEVQVSPESNNAVRLTLHGLKVFCVARRPRGAYNFLPH